MAVDKNMPILVVDDYSTMRNIVRNLLRQLGFDNVEEAANGEEAKNKLQEKKFNLVIADWGMQPVNGLELLKQIRADARLKGLPFIMLNSINTQEHAMAAKQAGVSNYILKPFNAETLKGKLSSIFGQF